jgi:pyruvate dehydrogenase E1 component beta subunit
MPQVHELSFKEAILESVFEEMKRDDNVFLIGEDVGKAGGVFKQTEGLFEAFGPARVIDAPISESGIFGLVVGAAMAGMRPIMEVMFGDFITLVMDQLVNQAAKVHYMSAGGFSAPLVLRTAVGVGGNLGPQHSQALHAWLAHVPGLKVVMPSTPADAKGLFSAAVRDPNPVVFIEDRMIYNLKGEVPQGEYVVPLGKANVVREGSDVTLVAVSRMVHIAAKAAEKLVDHGIGAEIVDLRSLVPLDTTTIVNSVKKTSRAVVLDSGHLQYGITGEIAAHIGEHAFDYLDAPVLRLGMPQVPVPYSKTLESLMLPTEEHIVERVLSMFGSPLGNEEKTS